MKELKIKFTINKVIFIRNLLLFIFLSFNSKAYFSQSIELLVKKGDVVLSSKKIKPGNIIKLKSTDFLELGNDARVLIKGNSELAEVPAGSNYSYNKLKDLLNNKTSYSKAFVEVATNQHVAMKRSSGVTTRGKDPWGFSPVDTAIILVDSFELSTGIKELRLLSDIIVYEINKTDTISLPMNNSKHRLENLTPGAYFWEYTVSYAGEERSYQNLFIIPNELDKKKYLDDYLNFQSSLKDFSIEMRELLLNDYIELKRIYFH